MNDISKPKLLKIEPYARLLTMLGEQLIKNIEIALIELIKNAYDADASFVKVNFNNFGDNLSLTEFSTIIIEDDGCGMDADLIENHWLNPATPEKLNRKKDKTYKTPKGRTLQGEKGIGRFALFKLGKKLKIISRKQIDESHGEAIENIIEYDFSQYDDDFSISDNTNNKSRNMFLNELSVKLSTQTPSIIIENNINLGIITQKRKPYGTRIEITNLQGNWNDRLLDRIQNEVSRLQPIFQPENKIDFQVYLYQNDNLHVSQEKIREEFLNVLNQRPVLKITDGKYIESTGTFEFMQNKQKIVLDFNDPDINSLRLFKDYFDGSSRQTTCGNFMFEFYIFDFNALPDSAYYLDKNDKKKIKDHRIYLYRDNVRVLPYGDVDDDWLKIDIDRGTISASAFLSNDQVVGCVYISQLNNPGLKDKTNREGLIDNGTSLNDFTFLLRLILKYVRTKPYTQYLIEKAQKKEHDLIKSGKPLSLIQHGKDLAKGNEKILTFLSDFEKIYIKEQDVLKTRITKTENLAAVGLSVETASHDLMLFLNKAIDKLDTIIKNLMLQGDINREAISSELTAIRGNMGIVEGLMKDIQLIFPSTKSKTKNILVKDIVEKVKSFYMKQIDIYKISVDIQTTNNPLIVKTTDAVLLQVFINLFDNAIYWLKDIKSERKIIISLDGFRQRILFSDSGPGIKDNDKNYIFEAFYSGKGEDGRGLGLYIARQLLDRYDYTIGLAEFSKDKLLNGANFVLEFIKN